MLTVLKKQQVLEQQHQVAAQQEKEKAAATLQPQMLSLQRQIASHQSTMPEQIQQSETNLAAQYQVMMRQQQARDYFLDKSLPFLTTAESLLIII